MLDNIPIDTIRDDRGVHAVLLQTSIQTILNVETILDS